MNYLSEDTVKCDAMHYIDDWGTEVRREEFLILMLEQRGYMLYIGSGYVPLRIAVATLSYRSDKHSDGSNDAAGIFEDWCRRTDRVEELCENEETGENEYVLRIEAIPMPICVMPAELEGARER